MIPYRITTTGTATEHYVVDAKDEDQARELFEAGEAKRVFAEVDDVEIVKVEAVGDGDAAKKRFILTARLWGGRADFEARTEESVVEAIRGFAYPEVWGYYRERKPGSETQEQDMFRCEFEIEAREREIREYLEETHDQMRTYFGLDYEIVEDMAEVAA